jgi:hypothetical protein
MKTLAILIFSLCSLTSYGQEIKTDSLYTLPAPAHWGMWSAFQFQLVLLNKFHTKVWRIFVLLQAGQKQQVMSIGPMPFCGVWRATVKMDAKIIESNMQQYYSGLIAANGIDTLSAIVVSFKEVKKENNDVKTFNGTIDMLDYMAKKPIKLYCKVHLTSHTAKTKHIHLSFTNYLQSLHLTPHLAKP